jgi:outer membrane protein
MKKITLILTAISACTFSLPSFAANSHGQRFAVSAGWMHIAPQGTAQGVNSAVQSDEPENFSDPNAGFRIKNANTAGLLVDYIVNDHVSLELVLGLPPKMWVQGKGTLLEGNIDLQKVDQLAELKAYTPALLAKYHFANVNAKFRPFVGAGLMYAHFSDLKATQSINSYLESSLDAQVQSIAAKDSIAPVALLGIDLNFNQNWYASASVSYAQLSTEATLTTQGFGTSIVGRSKIEINPVVTYLGIGYRF